MDEKRRPLLRRIHADEVLRSGASRFSLEFWRQQSTGDIIESLRPEKLESLKVKPGAFLMEMFASKFSRNEALILIAWNARSSD
jgi:hypothetical protein